MMSRIGKRAPSDYLSEVSDSTSVLKSHLLIKNPDSPLLKDNFEDFLRERQETFGELIGKLLGASYDRPSGVVSSTTYSPDVAEEGEDALRMEVPIDLSNLLTECLGEPFKRIETSNIYTSQTKTIAARWSRRYGTETHDPMTYWFRLTPRDISSAEEKGVSDFACICSDVGTILIPATDMKKHLLHNRLNSTSVKGEVHHEERVSGHSPGIVGL
jgi:hypothetical protein